VRPLLVRLGIVVALLAATLAVAQLQRLPESLYPVSWSVDRSGSAPEDLNLTLPAARSYAVSFAQPLVYNATRDATLAGSLVCSHRACGPLLWIKGDWTATRGPLVLRTDATTLAFEETARSEPPPVAPTPERNASEPVVTTATSPQAPAPYGDVPTRYDGVRYAIASPFEARDAKPLAVGAAALRLAPVALLAAAPLGVALWRRALIVVAAPLGGWMAFSAQAAGMGGILHVFVALATLMASAVAFVVVLAWRRRVSATALAGLAFGVAFLVTLPVAYAYLPLAGWGD